MCFVYVHVFKSCGRCQALIPAGPTDRGPFVGYQQQCPKLRVHPAPGVHISTAGCTILGGEHPVCARFLSHLLLLYIWRVHRAIFRVHSFMGSAPCECKKKKSLISDTEQFIHNYSDQWAVVNPKMTSLLTLLIIGLPTFVRSLKLTLRERPY